MNNKNEEKLGHYMGILKKEFKYESVNEEFVTATLFKRAGDSTVNVSANNLEDEYNIQFYMHNNLLQKHIYIDVYKEPTDEYFREMVEQVDQHFKDFLKETKTYELNKSMGVRDERFDIDED